MANCLCLIDSCSLDYFVNGKPPVTPMSHDKNLFQISYELLKGNDHVYFTTSDNFHDQTDCFKIYEVSPNLLFSRCSVPLQSIAWDMVVTVHPQLLNYELALQAKKVAIHPALYFVEMPDTYSGEQTQDMLNAICYHMDFLVVPNERARELVSVLYKYLCGWNEPDRILVAPLGIFPEELEVTPPSREACRAKMGLTRPDQLAFYNGGGVWRWTDFNNFLKAFLELKQEGLENIFLYISGIKQKENSDHIAYTQETLQLLEQYKQYVGYNIDTDQAEPAPIHFEADWSRGGEHVDIMAHGADLGLNINKDGLENWQSQRVRVLDYLKSGLPVLSTTDDSISSKAHTGCIFIEKRGVESYKQAIREILTKRYLIEEARNNIPRLQREFLVSNFWGRALDEIRRQPKRSVPPVVDSVVNIAQQRARTEASQELRRELKELLYARLR